MRTNRRTKLSRKFLAYQMERELRKLLLEDNDMLIEAVQKNITQIRIYYKLYGGLKADAPEPSGQFLKGLFGWVSQDRLNEFKKKLADINVDVFSRSGKFALSKLSPDPPKWQFTNPFLRSSLKKRAEDFGATWDRMYQNSIDTIAKKFIEHGGHPYDADFVKSVKSELNYNATYEAKRFARTEVGVIQNQAQAEVFTKNGVDGFEWSVAHIGNRRPNHQKLGGKKIRAGETFTLIGADGITYHPRYPQDSVLPVGEVANCTCDILPIVITDKPIEWSGQ